MRNQLKQIDWTTDVLAQNKITKNKYSGGCSDLKLKKTTFIREAQWKLIFLELITKKFRLNNNCCRLYFVNYERNANIW